jgi:hypothetical protein
MRGNQWMGFSQIKPGRDFRPVQANVHGSQGQTKIAVIIPKPFSEGHQTYIFLLSNQL